MTNPKKQIIVNEILFWKKNKMLPEHYCDFLMTLYTEGSGEQIVGDPKQAVKAKEKRKGSWLYIAVPLVAIILFATLFLADSFWVATVPAIVIGLGIILASFMVAKKNGLLIPILYVSGALIIFGASVKLCLMYFPEDNTAVYSVLVLNSLFWFVSGIKMKLMYLTLSGALGMLAIIIYAGMNM